MKYITCFLGVVLFLVGLGGKGFAKEPVTKGETDPVLKDFSPYLIKHLGSRSGWEKSRSIADLVDDRQFQNLVQKHHLKLFGGPMLGRMTGRSVTVWLRTVRPAKVRVITGSGPELEDPVPSEVHRTRLKTDLVAEIPVRNLSPSTTYHYQVKVDGEPVFQKDLPSFTTYPTTGSPGTFNVAWAACSRYIPQYEDVWSVIREQQPNAFLTLGDNLYIDAPRRYGKQRLHYYRRQLRSEYRSFTSRTPVYAIWDDHDFGKNDSSGGLDPFQPEWKPRVWRVFKRNWVNPDYGGGKQHPGCWFDFRIGDVHFIMTDGRYYRDFSEGTMLGPTQRKWLKKTLKQSEATFKIIASGTQWTRHADKNGRDSWWGVQVERDSLLTLIDRHQINGVVLISGDRHRADVWPIEWDGGYPLWEFTNARLTNKHQHPTKNQATFSYNKGRFFGLFEFDTQRDDPKITFRLIGENGKQIYSKSLTRSELSYSK